MTHSQKHLGLSCFVPLRAAATYAETLYKDYLAQLTQFLCFFGHVLFIERPRRHSIVLPRKIHCNQKEQQRLL
ncbi:hypothetical protein BDV18DRAFT_35573 [Aspergillus unguis]